MTIQIAADAPHLPLPSFFLSRYAGKSAHCFKIITSIYRDADIDIKTDAWKCQRILDTAHAQDVRFGPRTAAGREKQAKEYAAGYYNPQLDFRQVHFGLAVCDQDVVRWAL